MPRDTDPRYGGLPAWCEPVGNGELGCSVCGATAEELPVNHTNGCIYRLDIVA